MRICVAVLAAIFMAGCASTPDEPPKATMVFTKVKEPCISKTPKKPVYRFGKGVRPKSDAAMAQVLAEDFEAAEQYGTEWEAAAAGCVITPPQSKSD